MSEGVRKHLRTQGKYSDKGLHSGDKGHKSRDKRQKVSPAAKEPPEKKFHKRNSDGNKGASTSLADESASPLKYEENSDYSFTQLEDAKKPIEIKNCGKHVLSDTDNGESTVFYEPDFLYEGVAYDYFDRLHCTTNWHTKNIVIQGVEYPQPRLVAWYGPFPYSYSGATLEPAEMPEAVIEIKERVEQYLTEKGIEATFNSVLLNLYRNGKDSVSWHSDDELTMGISPTIASVSLGETRKFEMRRKMKHYEDESPADQMDKYFVRLTHGSLLIMTGCMQDDWQHRVPKEYHDKEARINLTFRTVFPLEKIPEHVPAKEMEKEPTANYNSSKTPSCVEINFDVENFPPLNSDISPICPNAKYNTYERNQCISPTLKKDDNVSVETWDSETSDDEQNVQNSVDNIHAYESTCATGDNKNEGSIIENYRRLSPLDSSASVTEVNNLDKRSPNTWRRSGTNLSENFVGIPAFHSGKWHKVGDNSSVNDDQENNTKTKVAQKKWHSVETKSSINDDQENNVEKKEAPRRWRRSEDNSCVNDRDNTEKKEAPRRWRRWADNSYVNDQENNMKKKEASRRWHRSEDNSCVNDQADNTEKKEAPRRWHRLGDNSCVNDQEKNTEKKEAPRKWHRLGDNSCVNDQENNREKKEAPRKWHRLGDNSSLKDDQENNTEKKEAPRRWRRWADNSYVNEQENNTEKKEALRKWHRLGDNSCVNDQENNTEKEEAPIKWHRLGDNSSVKDDQENNTEKKEAPRKWGRFDANSYVNDDQENNVEKKESPKKWHKFETNSYINDQENNFAKKDPPKQFRNGEVYSTLNGTLESNVSKEECPIKCRSVEADSPVDITGENNLDWNEASKTCRYEANSQVNVTQKNNLDKQEPPKSWLNVEAKEFVPCTITSYEVNYYSRFDLEDLIHYEICLMQGEQLRDHAYALKDKVLERLYDFKRSDREELEFLCSLTDGSQTDKNQKLISARICNTVINALLEISQTPSSARRSFDGNSRQRGFGNQSNFSDRGRRFQNQGRNNNHRY